MGDNTEQAVTVAVLEQKVKTLEEHLDRTDKQLKALQRDRDSALKWGVMVLGSAVLSMGTWIFNSITSRGG